MGLLNKIITRDNKIVTIGNKVATGCVICLNGHLDCSQNDPTSLVSLPTFIDWNGTTPATACSPSLTDPQGIGGGYPGSCTQYNVDSLCIAGWLATYESIWIEEANDDNGCVGYRVTFHFGDAGLYEDQYKLMYFKKVSALDEDQYGTYQFIGATKNDVSIPGATATATVTVSPSP